jgi:hypothetical protein
MVLDFNGFIIWLMKIPIFANAECHFRRLTSFETGTLPQIINDQVMKTLLLPLAVLLSLCLQGQIHYLKMENVELRQMNKSDIDFGDYDNDGDLDVLLSGLALVGATISTESYIYRNDGNGVFTDINADIPGLHSGTADWGDIDNDGDLDFMLTGDVGSSGSYNTRMVLNDGGDNFSYIDLGLPDAESGAFCDLNNDGLVDIVLLNNYVNILLNKGDYTFESIGIDYPGYTQHQSISFGDFNNDGFNDFSLNGIEYDGGSFTRNFLYRNNRDNSFTKIEMPALENLSGAKTAFQDLDGDGDVDLIAFGYSWTLESAATIILENTGKDQFTEASHNLPKISRAELSFADYDNNGHIDIAVSGFNYAYDDEETHIYQNQGGWNFTVDENTTFEPNNIFDIEFGDLDRDNDLDLSLTVNPIWNNLGHLYDNESNGNTNSEPTVPQALVSMVKNDSVKLSWDKSEDTETDADLLTYNLYIKRGDQLIINPGANINSGLNKRVKHGNSGFNNHKEYPVNGYEEGHYFWSVQAIDQGYLSSAFYPYQEFTIYHNNLEDAPTYLELLDYSPDSVVLNWPDESDSETVYIVERSLSNQDSFEEIAQLPADSDHYVDLTFAGLQEYFYRIKMVTDAGNGYSEIRYVKTSSVNQGGPTNLSAEVVSASEIKLTWSDNSEDEISFVVESSMYDNNSFTTATTLAPNTTQTVLGGLNASTLYFFRVKAVNAQGDSPFSNTANATTAAIIFTLEDLFTDDLSQSTGMSWGDYNNDGWEDLFVSSKDLLLYKNNGNGTYSRIFSSGIETDQESWYLYGTWGDYDNDGFLDLFLCDEDNPNTLFWNNGSGKFEKVDAGLLVTENKETKSASWTDYDNDGDLDIFLSENGGDRFYRNDGDNEFTAVSMETGNYTYGTSWGDYNNDGYPDLYVANKMKNDFFENDGKGGLTKITDSEITNNPDYYTSFSVSWADYNNDGHIDLLVLNDDSGDEWLFRNNGDGTFSRVGDVFQYDIYKDDIYTGFWLDYDNDGDQDIYLYVNKYEYHKHKLYTNIGNDTFTYSEVDFGPMVNYYTHYGSTYDVDNDGFDDMLICRNEQQLIKNNGNGNNWIKLSLKGSPSNSFGVGARVFVKADGQWQNKTVQTLHAYRAQNGNHLRYGLSNAQVIDSIMVYWPMGTIQTLTNVDVNQKLVIKEEDAAFKPLYKPVNLKTTCVGQQIHMKWQDYSDEEHFIIERSLGDTTAFVEYAVLPANTTAFTDQEVVMNTTHFYRVKARKGTTSSLWSYVVSGKPSLYTQSDDEVLTQGNGSAEAVAWADYNNDGYPDLYVGNYARESYLYQNMGDGSFTQITDTPVTAEDPRTTHGAWADYNRDGNLDLFVVNGAGGGFGEALNNNLFRNSGDGSYQKVTNLDIVQDKSPSLVACWGDYNKDGNIDLYVGGMYPYSFLYKNSFDYTFTEVQNQPMTGEPAGDALWTDFDLDNDLDLITLTYNRLNIYQQMENGDFHTINNDTMGLTGSVGGNSINVEDFNNDGLFDIFIAADDTNHLFINHNGKYKRIPFGNLSMEPADSETSVCADVNNDGFLDIFEGNIDTKDYLYLNNGDNTFSRNDQESISEEQYPTLSAAFADHDNDGSQDLFVGTNLKGNRFFTHTCGGGNYIKFILSGDRSMVDNVLGTKIRIVADGLVQIRELRSNSGSGAQNGYELHFGLGNAEIIESVTITTPEGKSDVLYGVYANQTYTLNMNYLGLEDQPEYKLFLCPNPTSGTFSIRVPEGFNGESVRVVNLSGQVVYERFIRQNEEHLSIDHIPAGYYLVTLSGRDGVLQEKLVVVR